MLTGTIFLSALKQVDFYALGPGSIKVLIYLLSGVWNVHTGCVFSASQTPGRQIQLLKAVLFLCAEYFCLHSSFVQLNLLKSSDCGCAIGGVLYYE